MNLYNDDYLLLLEHDNVITSGRTSKEGNLLVSIDDLKVVSDLKPSQEQLDDFMFAWKVAKFVKSNAIVLAHFLKYFCSLFFSEFVTNTTL